MKFPSSLFTSFKKNKFAITGFGLMLGFFLVFAVTNVQARQHKPAKPQPYKTQKTTELNVKGDLNLTNDASNSDPQSTTSQNSENNNDYLQAPSGTDPGTISTSIGLSSTTAASTSASSVPPTAASVTNQGPSSNSPQPPATPPVNPADPPTTEASPTTPPPAPTTSVDPSVSTNNQTPSPAILSPNNLSKTFSNLSAPLFKNLWNPPVSPLPSPYSTDAFSPRATRSLTDLGFALITAGLALYLAPKRKEQESPGLAEQQGLSVVK